LGAASLWGLVYQRVRSLTLPAPALFFKVSVSRCLPKLIDQRSTFSSSSLFQRPTSAFSTPSCSIRMIYISLYTFTVTHGRARLLYELDTSHLDPQPHRASAKYPRPNDEQCLRIPTCSGESSVDRPVPIPSGGSGLPRRCRGPRRKGLPPIRPSLFLRLDSSESILHHVRVSASRKSQRRKNPIPQVKMRPFCTILVQCKSFRCNTCKPPRMCCRQRTCTMLKFCRCNTYRKHGGG
jgi:hypothetical protein